MTFHNLSKAFGREKIIDWQKMYESIRVVADMKDARIRGYKAALTRKENEIQRLKMDLARERDKNNEIKKMKR